MSASVYVVDSTMRRTQVKVTPGKYLREVLEEACKAKKLNPEQYTLKNQNNKPVDLSQPFRLSGLSAGAKLQLTQASKSPSVVSIALQLPESEGGGRLSDKFPSNTSIWLVLRKFEEGVAGQASKKLNLTQRAITSDKSGSGRLLYEQPSLNVMGRSLESFTDLQKTLAQLGFNSGSVMMRLSFKNSGQPLEEAMGEITQYFEAVSNEASSTQTSATETSATREAQGAHASTEGNFSSMPDADASNSAVPLEGAAGPEPNDEDVEMTPAPPATRGEGDDVVASSSETQLPVSTPPSATQESSTPQDNSVNGISVYSAPSRDTPAAALEADDPSTWQPSIEHAKAHQAALERAGKNTRLLSDKELEEQEAERRAKLATVQSVTVRVRYPDQSMIETTLYASDTTSQLYSKVRDTLTHASEPFELKFVGNKGHQTLPDNDQQRLVRDFGFRGKVLVTLVWAQAASQKARQEPSLKEEYRSRAKELNVDLSAYRSGPDNVAGSSAAGKADASKKENKGKGGGDLEAKMKKFLGFGKK